MGKGISITTLGNLTFWYRGKIFTGFTSRKAKALLLYLAVERGNYHQRESLFTLLWPGTPEGSARHNLSQLIYAVRKTFPDVAAKNSDKSVPLLLSDRRTAQINPEALVDVDIHKLDHLLDEIQKHEHLNLENCESCFTALLQSSNLYCGEFLSDFYLDDSNQFEAWCEAVRENYRRKILEVLETMSNIAIYQQDFEQACNYIDKQLSIDNLRESGHRQMMEMLALSGRRVEALRHYNQFFQILNDELNIAPSGETIDLYERIRQHGLVHLPIQLEVQTKISDLSSNQETSTSNTLVDRHDVLPLADGTPQTPEISPISIFGLHNTVQVYKIYHPGLDQYVAVKALHRHLATESDYIDRFKREAEAIAILDHPNIVPVFDFDSDGDLLYMVKEYIEGLSLKDVLHERQAKNQDFSIEEIAIIFTEISSAIDYAHQHNVTHQDLQPANIMFTRDGQILVDDFGFSRILKATRHTFPGTLTDTPEYSSPETSWGEGGDKSSDIYSLGVILYQIVTGHVPFKAKTPMDVLLQHISSPVPLPSKVKADIPERLEQIILKATHKAPDKRFQSAGELAQAIREIAGLPPIEMTGTTDLQIPEIHIQTESLSDQPPLQQKPPSFEAQYLPSGPFQAPRDISNFVGRELEIKQLEGQIRHFQEQNIFCFVGMSGVGKTALAVHLAHKLRGHFSDGVLWASVSLSQPSAILESWAQALNLDFSQLPDIASRAAALRGELSEKQTLIILDDVASSDAIQHLLPSSTKSTVLITTRNSDLPIVLGAQKIELQILSVDSCQNIIKNILGKVRYAKESAEDITELIMILGGLPLAVEIVARRLFSRPRWRISTIIERIHSQKNLLDELVMSDLAVRASFAMSWEALSKKLQQFLALIGVFEGRAFRASALAAIAEISRDEADDYLHGLAALSLVSEKGEKHYQQHPLLADFSLEQLGSDDDAFKRMVRHFLAYTQQYQDDYPALEGEWDNITSSLHVAYQKKMYAEVLSYNNCLEKARFARGYFSEARQAYPWACEAAEVLDLPLATAKNHRMWAQACIEQGDYEEAVEYLNRSIEISQALNEPGEFGRAQHALGRIAIELSHLDEAENLLSEAQDIHERTGDTQAAAEDYYMRAHIPFYKAQYLEAKTLAHQALTIQEKINDKLGMIRSLNLLADILQQTKSFDLAEEHAQRALDICDEINEFWEKATTLYTLAGIYHERGDLEIAREFANKSFNQFKKIGDRKSQAMASYRLCSIARDDKDYSFALEIGLKSLGLFRELNDARGTLYTLYLVGLMHKQLNQSDQAFRAWSEALIITEKEENPLWEELAKSLKSKLADL